MKDESVIDHAETKEAKEEIVIKKVLLCKICSEFKAKQNCSRCNRPVCLNYKRFFYRDEPEMCKLCYDRKRAIHDKRQAEYNRRNQSQCFLL